LKNLKKDFVMPILVLTLLCLLMTGALALVNNITYPVIKEGAAERAYNARKEIIPEAEAFVLLEPDWELMPETVAEIYGTNNNTGYIFVVYTYGYGGNIKLICGIDPGGKIIKSRILAHKETQGLGTIVFDRAVAYEGQDENFARGLDAIAGSTITSNAYKNAILDAFAAYEAIKTAEGEEESHG
jgi:electron transport complex protein RnfG